MQSHRESAHYYANPRRCPICDSTSTRFFASGQDRLFGVAPGTFNLYACTACECIFQHPFPAPDILPSFYPQTYWWGSGEDARPGFLSRLALNLERAYREFVALDHVRFIERCVRAGDNRQVSLLDVGCGSGTILYLAKRRGFRTFGVDVSATAVAAARRQYGLEAEQGTIESIRWNGRSFDCITMHHVLEHLQDPLAALHSVAGLLKEEGSLIVQVPNVASLQSRTFGKRWYGLDIPRHIINFSPRGLALLLERAGFGIIGEARFSLRDNPASIASSLVPRLDPIGRTIKRSGALTTAFLNFVYFLLFGLSVPLALIESGLGRGGTLWIHARTVHSSWYKVQGSMS